MSRWLHGLAVPYNTPTLIPSDRGAYIETVAPGTFRRSLTGNPVPLLGLHDVAAYPIGSAVEWDDRPDGLYARWHLANTPQARDVYRMVRDRHLSALSVGFQPVVSDWTLGRNGQPDRVTRVEARLLEVSVVAIGAYDAAHITDWGHDVTPATNPTPRLDAAREWAATVA